MSEAGWDLAKGAILTLALTGLGYILSGWIVGVICLFIAGILLLIHWTRLGAWLGLHSDLGNPGQADLPPGYSPAERLDNLLYPPRDDRRELGEQCVTFAIKMRGFTKEHEAKQEMATARYAQEIRSADPDLDPLDARKSAESQFARNVESAYALELRDEAIRLFDEARAEGAIAANVRRIPERPLIYEMGKVANLFIALAHRLNCEPVADPRSAPPPNLAAQIDSLMRDGIDLVAELNESVAAQETTKGVWKLEGGDAPEEWWEKADTFIQRIRTLLIEDHPALLTDYRTGFNAHLKAEREGQKHPATDKRSTAEKMLDLATFERSGPRRVVEAGLEGLSAARHQLGPENELVPMTPGRHR